MLSFSLTSLDREDLDHAILLRNTFVFSFGSDMGLLEVVISLGLSLPDDNPVNDECNDVGPCPCTLLLADEDDGVSIALRSSEAAVCN